MIVDKPTVMTIAGSDSCGGAGVQGDLRTISSIGGYGLTVITAITAQNHQKVESFYPVPASEIRKQIEALTFHQEPEVVKTGMLVNADTVKEVIRFTEKYPHIPLIIDPVIRSTSGKRLIDTEGEKLLIEKLFRKSILVTPNTGEVELLTGKMPESVAELEKAGAELVERFGASFFMKGGHLEGNPEDVLVTPSGVSRYPGKRVYGINTHGSGCTCASAAATFIAQGYSVEKAIYSTKIYINKVIENGCRLPDGEVVINHEAFALPGTQEGL